MNLFYSIAYLLGFTPWEKAATHAPAARQVEALFAREEAERTAPFGRALDIGCGRGHWALTLARRGWDVTGVDNVAKAIRTARARAREAGMNITFIHADITAIREAEAGPGFRLFFDFGALHGLPAAQREAAGRRITAIAAADATMLLLAWTPGKRGFLPRGLSDTDVRDMFPHWRIVDVEPFDATGLPPPLRNVEPRIYRLRRR